MFDEFRRIVRSPKIGHKRRAVAIAHMALWPMLLLPRLIWPRKKRGDPSRILLVRIDGIGDLTMSLAVFPALRRRFPHAQIDLLTSDAARPIAELLVAAGWINTVRVMRLLRRTPSMYFAMARELRYDAGIDLRGDVRTVLLLWLAGMPMRIGLSGSGFSYLLTVVVDLPAPSHQADEVRELVKRLGVEMPDEPSRLPLQPEHFAAAEKWLAAEGARLGRVICAFHLGAFQPCKVWPLERFIDVARRLREGRDVDFLIVGGLDDKPLADALAREVGGLVMIAAGRTSLLETAALLSRCGVFVGNDSGPAHLAAAVGCPAVVLFGLGSPAIYRPLGTHVKVMQPHHPCDPRCFNLCSRPDAPCIKEHLASVVALEAAKIIRTLPQSEGADFSGAEYPIQDGK